MLLWQAFCLIQVFSLLSYPVALRVLLLYFTSSLYTVPLGRISLPWSSSFLFSFSFPSLFLSISLFSLICPVTLIDMTDSRCIQVYPAKVSCIFTGRRKRRGNSSRHAVHCCLYFLFELFTVHCCIRCCIEKQFANFLLQ